MTKYGILLLFLVQNSPQNLNDQRDPLPQHQDYQQDNDGEDGEGDGERHEAVDLLEPECLSQSPLHRARGRQLARLHLHLVAGVWNDAFLFLHRLSFPER